MDYYLSSDLMEPSQAEQHYSEKLVRLPNLALCCRRPQLPKAPKTRYELGIPTDRFVYLSTQSIFKYLPQHDEIFVQIALQVPEAFFVFISNPSTSATERFRHRLKAAFKACHLEVDRFCHFSPRLNFDDFLNLNMAADVLLDTLDWSGGKTTLEALSCSVPVVTSPGRFMRGRHAYAMLKRVGVLETIGSDKADYIRIAVRLARDPSFYSAVKSKLKRGCHKLYNDLEFMSRLEIFYKSVVEKHLRFADDVKDDIV
jgi:predicted O-linked N-acetylglucosamine transferase (SPINDLY family)